MADGFALVVLLVAAALYLVGTLIILSTWRSEPNRKRFYGILALGELGGLHLLEQLLALVGVPLAWRNGVEGVLFALVVATLVLLYRHRHDPEPDDL